MATQISYFMLFGILASSRGTPSFRSSNTNHNEFLKRLQEFYSQGKYEIALSHHEDSPKSHHLDKYWISYKEKPSSFASTNTQREENFRNPVESKLYIHKSTSKLPNLNALYAARQNEDNDNENNATCMKKWAQCTETVWRVGKMIENDASATVGEVLDFLIEYEKILEDNGLLTEKRHRAYDEDLIIYNKPKDDNNRMRINNKYLLRCQGHGCTVNVDDGQDRDDDDDEDDRNDGYHQRNAGNRYESNRDYRNDYNRNNLRCFGNRCEGNRGDRDDDDRYDRGYLRCVGNRCGRNRENRDDDDDDDRFEANNLRCVGDRCSRNRGDRDDDEYRNEEYLLRCVGNRCSRNRDDRDYDRNDRGELSCVGDRCGRSSNDRDDDDRDYRGDLRCRGNNCARSNDDNDDNNSGLDAINNELPDGVSSLSNLNDRGNADSPKEFKIEENAQIQKLLKDRDQLINKLKNLMSNS